MNKYGESRKPDDTRSEIYWYWPKYKNGKDIWWSHSYNFIHNKSSNPILCTFRWAICKPFCCIKESLHHISTKALEQFIKNLPKKGKYYLKFVYKFQKRVSVKYYSIVNEVRTGTCICNRPSSCTRLEQKYVMKDRWTYPSIWLEVLLHQCYSILLHARVRPYIIFLLWSTNMITFYETNDSLHFNLFV